MYVFFFAKDYFSGPKVFFTEKAQKVYLDTIEKKPSFSVKNAAGLLK